ncbi:threonine aldolase family protein [Pseudaestuariivita sp.]|uniref:threonine aldolase family protein n=1 Tax=Pseudaestuariivita sp. TaxID=2211669 RepID=UPI004058CDE1
MFFASDNAGPALPQVMQALVDCNAGHVMPYGADAHTAEAVRLVREAFEAPEASVHLVATGTAANALALATLSQPWETIFCTPVAHIHEDECNAPEFYTGGAKLTLVGAGHKMTPDALRKAIEAEGTRGVHGPQRGPVSITQVTEKGGVYAVPEIAALAEVTKAYGLPLHLDGARFANALVTTNASPAEMTWRAGVDVVSFGGTKNGCPGIEAVVFFDPAHGQEFELRRKRGGHLFSKHRYLGAQMEAYLKDGLWLDAARKANRAAGRLAEGLRKVGSEFLAEPEANVIFAHLTRAQHQALHADGAVYYLMDGPLETGPADEKLLCRFVCDWSISDEQIDTFLALL